MHLEAHLLRPVADLASASQVKPFDALVVGGGTSGVVSAVTLAERGLSVAILEAGPLLLLTHVNSTDLRFDSTQAGELRRRVEYTPGHGADGQYGPLVACLGGRGMFWNGASPRMEEHEFAAWPYSAAELDVAYMWAESQFRVNVRYGDTPLAQALLRSLRARGASVRALPFAIDAGTTENGWLRGTVGNAVSILLRSRALWHPDTPVRVAGNAFATALRFDQAGTRVNGVEVIDRATKAKHELAARSIVLAAGAFESTRLAMVSRAPDKSGRLGSHIVDHLFCRANFALPLHWYDPERREVALLHFPAHVDQKFQLELHAPAGLLFNANEARPWRPEATREYAAMVRSFGSVSPRPESRIEPAPGDEPGKYVVHLDYNTDDLAKRDAMHSAIARVGEVLGAPSTTIEDLPPGRSYHEAGGLAMSPTADRGVTDPFGRFHHCPNLMAADAAAWPTIAAANPHLTIAAHARRAATQLATDLAMT